MPNHIQLLSQEIMSPGNPHLFHPEIRLLYQCLLLYPEQPSAVYEPAPDTFPTLAKCGANYMNSQLAKLEAIEHGYDEAIMLDYEGHVSEGSGENIFIVEDGVLYTPSMDSSNLKGITRESIKQLANDLGYEVVEEGISRERLYFADEVFFSGTAAEVTPIRSIDHKIIGAGKRGPISEKLQKTFFDIVEGKKDDKFGWLDYI